MLLLGTLMALGGAGTARGADSPRVAIEGGVRQDNPQFYAWKVTNHHTSPIVFIEFPQYHGDSFTAPPGWNQEWKGRAMAGTKGEPGWVRTSVDDPLRAIPPGGSAEFEMRTTTTGALPRPGAVTVRFADGTVVSVSGVELPTAQSFLERNVMGIGLALIFGIAVLVHLLRRRRKAASVAAARPATSDPPE